MNTIETMTLDNGLRLHVVPMDSYSIGVGLFIRVGSRYEADEEGGIAHFIEHMLFKGTKRRPSARELSQAIEGIGGIFNANTGRELTTYWAKVGRDHLEIALDVLIDMVSNSLFKEEEIEKERRVIIEEINESFDTPEDIVFLLLDELMWPSHPLGRDVAGTRETVANLSHAQITALWNRFYRPENMVLSVAGPVDLDGVAALVAPRMKRRQNGDRAGFRSVPPHMPGPQAVVRNRDIEQAHLCIACPGIPRNHPDRFALRMLNAVLGEGMSSRLFLEVRERQGLAYSVYSYSSFLSDSGVIGTYAGVDPQRLGDALAAILGEWDRLRQHPVSQEDLSRAKEFVKGRTLLRLEDSYANASWVGVQSALDDEVRTVEDVLSQIDHVMPDDIQRIAQTLLLEENLHMTIVGSLPEEGNWAQELHF